MRLSFAILYLTVVAYGQTAAPTITSAQPNPVDAGGPAFTLTVNGSGFASGAVVKWSGITLATTFASDTMMTAVVPPNLIAICGKSPITVTNPQGTVTSTGNFFVTVNPVLTLLNPNVVAAGSGSGTITATGLGFSSNVVLALNASGTRTTLPTTYVSPTTLTAFIPASAFNGVYPVSLQVTDPTTGGASQTLPVTLIYADIGQIFPDRILAGGPDFTLQVAGVNFVFGAQVLWNGTPLVTQYQNSGFLTATVPALLVNNAPAPFIQVGISVRNPGAAATRVLLLILYANPPGTTITSLDPAAAATGGPAFLLTVTGASFVPASTIIWQTTPLVTTFVSPTQLTATVPASLITTNGSVAITVATPNVAASNIVNLPIVSSTPTIASLSPASAAAGGPAFTLTVNGKGFVPASRVDGVVGGTTTYVSNTQLTVSVPASAIASVGSLNIRVIDPSGNASQGTSFAITAAATPALSGLTPASATAGGAAFTLTVNGTGFGANSTVQWNGTALPTTFAGSSQLAASVPATLIATAGTANVTVAANGVTSNALPFAIAPVLPTTSTAGIVNAASSAPAMAPGTLISIYGTNLGLANVSANAIPLLTSMGGTTVSINGTPAPLLFVSPGQINAQIPYEINPGTARLSVHANGLDGAPVSFSVAATGPGVFTLAQSNHAVAVNLPDFVLNAAQAPALPGQYVTLYVTGQGALDNGVPSGAGAPASPLSRPLAGVEVRIGNQVADIQFAGLAPGFVGLLQINVKIPDLAAGDQPVDVTIGGVKASTAVISVGAK